MNGVHDLGGMHGFGPIGAELHEVVTFEDWERRVRAIHQAARGHKIYNVDEFRYGIERMNPARYLDSAYYEHWFDGICRILDEKGVVSEADIAARAEFFQHNPDATASDALKAPPAPAPVYVDSTTLAKPATAPRFSVGDVIITRTINPTGHTRLPRYARGKRGTIARVYSAAILPDVSAWGVGAPTEAVYNVLFEGRELWGDTSDPNLRVYLDCWDSYLLPAGA